MSLVSALKGDLPQQARSLVSTLPSCPPVSLPDCPTSVEEIASSPLQFNDRMVIRASNCIVYLQSAACAKLDGNPTMFSPLDDIMTHMSSYHLGSHRGKTRKASADNPLSIYLVSPTPPIRVAVPVLQFQRVRTTAGERRLSREPTCRGSQANPGSDTERPEGAADYKGTGALTTSLTELDESEEGDSEIAAAEAQRWW